MNDWRPVWMMTLLLTACTAPATLREDAARTWGGAPYDEVAARWGAPTRSTTLEDGRIVHTWVSEATQRRGTVFPSIGLFGGSGGIGGVGVGATVGPGGVGLARCERTLVFRNGRAVEQTWLGDGDYCGSFRRN